MAKTAGFQSGSVAEPKKKRRQRAHSVKADAGPLGYGATIGSGGGESQQIPQDVLVKSRKDIIAPPLGECSFEFLAQLLTDSTDFATVVEQQATDIAGRGWHLAPMDQDVEIDEAEFEIAMNFLGSPNPTMTLGEIMKCAHIDLGTLGNGWIEVLREGNSADGVPTGLAHAPGIMMRINSNMAGFVMLSRDYNKMAYFRTLFSDPENETSKDPRTGDLLNEMIFLRRYHPGSAWYGIPQIVTALRAIKGNIHSAERNIRFFVNRAYPEWSISIVQQTDNVNSDSVEELEDDLKEHFRNVLKGDDFRTLINSLPAGIKLEFQELAAKLNDGELRQYRIDNRDEILRAYQMPPNRVGIVESANLGTGSGESQIEIYNTSVIKPKQETTERIIDALLHSERPLGLGLKTVRFKWDEIDSIDEAREASIATMIASTGWMTINEGRAYCSQFLKTDLEQIEEAWADLPLQILLPQLDTFLQPLESVAQEEPGLRPGGVSQFGTPMLLSDRGGDVLRRDPLAMRPQTRLAIDKAYRRIRDRQQGLVAAIPEEEPSTNGN